MWKGNQDMKKIKCVVLGYGDRGSRYAEYAKFKPDELEIVGVIDTNETKRNLCKEAYGLKDEQVCTFR